MSRYYVVTGAAGFIGSNLIAGLNARGITNIIAVDNLTKGDKFRNLVDCEIADYMDKHDFRDAMNNGAFDGAVQAVLHQGACSLEKVCRFEMSLIDEGVLGSDHVLVVAAPRK